MMTADSAHPVLVRNNVSVKGEGSRTLVFGHGFGCDQTMWRFLTPYFDEDTRLVLYDYTGCGGSDVSQFDGERYADLNGYALDLIELCDALKLESVCFVGHSVSATIGLLAAIKRPDLFSSLVFVCPSPCFLNIPPEYEGGFDRADLEELINLMDKNHVGWANYLAPVVMGETNGEGMVTELTQSFCSTDPTFLKPFALATFFSDHRADFERCRVPSLILQSSTDALASQQVGESIHANTPHSQLAVIDAIGHCLHMTHPEQVADEIRRFQSKL